MKKTKENLRHKMDVGEKEETVYDDTGREKLMDDDEISPEEEAFMEGAEDDGEQAKCAYCGNILFDNKTVETKVDGKVYWFCCQKHAEKFIERRKGKDQLA